MSSNDVGKLRRIWHIMLLIKIVMPIEEDEGSGSLWQDLPASEIG